MVFYQYNGHKNGILLNDIQKNKYNYDMKQYSLFFLLDV